MSDPFWPHAFFKLRVRLYRFPVRGLISGDSNSIAERIIDLLRLRSVLVLALVRPWFECAGAFGGLIACYLSDDFSGVKHILWMREKGIVSEIFWSTSFVS